MHIDRIDHSGRKAGEVRGPGVGAESSGREEQNSPGTKELKLKVGE